MKKLLIVSVCLMAGTAMAAVPAGFDLPASVNLNGDTGDGADILVMASGAGAIQGMSLYLEASAPVSIDSLAIDNVGGLFTFPGTSTGASIYTFATTPEVVPVPQLAVGYVTASSTVSAAASSVLAKLHISIPAGTAHGVAVLSTYSQTMAIGSDFVDPAAQDTMIINIIPEPVTALLLLAGLPFLRRRVA